MRKLKSTCLLVLLILFITSCSNDRKQKDNLNDFRLLETNISTLQDGYKSGKYSVKEVVEEYINRINKIDSKLHSIIQLNPDAIRIAKNLDDRIKENKISGALFGIPIVLKDNIDTHDKMQTTAGSRALSGSHPLKDSFIAKKLREAGAVILAKANLSEWANFRGDLSSSGWSGIGGQTKNPYDLTRNPCGSSSGSAVAVSANLTVLAIGTETNGSIVCPSNANGIVGIKPTVGLASRSGIIPISFTQDTPGPMARTITDAAICLGAISGEDIEDSKTLSTSKKVYSDYTKFLNLDGIAGKRIGIYTAPLGNNYKVDTIFANAVKIFKESGAELIEIDKIGSNDVGQNSFEIMLYEYKDGLNKYFKSLGENAPIKSVEELIKFNTVDSVELKFFNQVYLKMANEKGNLSSKEYKRALKKMLDGIRKNGIDKVMDENNLDAIISPTGSPAWKTDHLLGDNFQLSSSSPAARAGYPNITVPMGFVDELPINISIFGRAWSEPVLLEIAYSFEQKTKARRAPKFLGFRID